MKNEFNTLEKARTWFCVLNHVDRLFNKEDKAFLERDNKEVRDDIIAFRELLPDTPLTPEQIVDFVVDLWIQGKPSRSCGVNYEIGESQVHHLHMVLEDSNQVRFSTLKQMFPTAHLEITRGAKKDVEAYLNKTDKFEDKAHTVVVPVKIHGEIMARQGARSDLDEIEHLLNEGYTPEQIFKTFKYRKYEYMIRSHFHAAKLASIEYRIKTNKRVVWHTGLSGTGKTYYLFREIPDKYGRENVFYVSDCKNAFDIYESQSILLIDDYKGGFTYRMLLDILGEYVVPIAARYKNVESLWHEVHVSSIYSPDELFVWVIKDRVNIKDTPDQLFRRIDEVMYHFKTNEEQYKTITFSLEAFRTYESNIEEICAYYHERFPDECHYIFEQPDNKKVPNTGQSSGNATQKNK